MTPDPHPFDLFRWIEVQFALWQIATERLNQTDDERWLIAAHGSAQALKPLLEDAP